MAGKDYRYLLYGLFLLLLIACQSHKTQFPADEQSGPVYMLKTPDNHRLRDHIEILVDSTPGYTIQDIMQPRLQKQFIHWCDTAIELHSNQVYWGKIQIENHLPDTNMHSEWVLSFANSLTEISLFQKEVDGHWTAKPNGSFVPLHQKSFVPTTSGNLYRLELPPRQSTTLYFRAITERTAISPSFNIYLQPLSVFYDKLVAEKTRNTLFTGLMMMMLFYNMLNYFFVRDRSYLFYTGYLSMVLVYTAYASESLKDWLGHMLFVGHPAWFSLFKISLHLGLMCYLAFIRNFLDLKNLLPKWDLFFRLVIWLGVPLIGIFLFQAFYYNFNYEIEDRLILFYVALVAFSGIFFIFPLLKTKDQKGLFITAGIVAISLGFLLTWHSRLMQSNFTVFYLKIATILEVLIFSMGLAYRQKQQELARQQADFALRESQLIQEQKQAEANRLQELNEFKSRFFTNITHEFRTPLTVILGMSEQLLSEKSALNQPLTLIKRNGENLLRLVNQILDLAKLESKTLKMNYVQGDVLAFMRYVVESMHSLANAQNVLLRTESPQTQIVMDYDPERLQQIVYNLLSNAIKFTPSGGKVLLHANLDGQWLHITVNDTGSGIPKEELPHIFEQFFQAQNQEHAKAGGTGIGLSLTRELVKAMGGDIAVESTVGAGSTFVVKLPVTNKSAFEDKTVVIKKMTAPQRQTALSTDATDSDKPLVLLIEDNPDVVEYLTACLKNHYSLEYAYNGQAGIDTALEKIPDLIVSDVMMPYKDGFEVVEFLKNEEHTSHIPIILLTAKADVQSRLTGLRKRADAYLAKPFNPEELLITIENLLENRRKLQLKYQQQVLAPGAGSVVADSAEIEDVFLQKVRSVIDANYSKDDFGLPQLCQKIGMSRSQLFRKMKALTDIAPSDLIRTHRLNKAKALLESGAANVAEAAWQVGFKDPSYFSKLFQEEFGEMPSTTRK